MQTDTLSVLWPNATFFKAYPACGKPGHSRQFSTKCNRNSYALSAHVALDKPGISLPTCKSMILH